MDEKSKVANVDTNKKIEIQVHHKYFTTSLIEILNLLLKQSCEIDFDKLDVSVKQNVKVIKSHTKLRSVCNELKKGFSSEQCDFDQGRIIKKIYRVLTQNLDKLYPDPDKSLFTLKNDKGETVTIIPGLDMGLVTGSLNEEDTASLWGHMYMLYVSSVAMISAINNHKKEGKVWDVVPKIKEKVTKLGMFGKSFNPFVGLMNETTEYNVKTMFEKIDDIKAPSGPSMEDIFKMTGVDKLVDVNQLGEQLKNVKQEDINEATASIAKLLGAEHDSDIREVCGTLVEGIVSDLKANPDGGLKGMFETAKSVTEKLGPTIDKAKMKKTASKLTSFLKNGESNLKNMKDDKGNPIGEKIMESLKLPLKLAESMEGKRAPELSDYKELMAQVNSAVATVDGKKKSDDEKSIKKKK